MNDISNKLYRSGIIPVVKINKAEQAVELAKALMAGGIYCMELTFRTAAAAEAIALISKEVPEMLVGAGTVLNAQQAQQAVEAGAKFVVTPGLCKETVERCKELETPIYPGCCTPSDISEAMAMGLTELKFFPAESAGGVNMLKSLSGPYAKVKFIPTGGISTENMCEYLSCRNVLAAGGSWMVKESLIENEDWAAITELARQAVEVMLGYTFLHMGINCPDAETANSVSGAFGDLLGWSLNENPKSIFAGKYFEVTKSPFLGKMGHICIGTNNLDRAYDRFLRKGFTLNEGTAQYDEEGHMTVVYLNDEFGGFAVHFLLN